MENKFDLIKHGFKHSGGGIWEKCVSHYTVKVTIDRHGLYSVKYINWHDSQPTHLIVANSYTIETQEQLDFLICNGQIKYLVS
jgi:hypothetical protein